MFVSDIRLDLILRNRLFQRVVDRLIKLCLCHQTDVPVFLAVGIDEQNSRNR